MLWSILISGIPERYHTVQPLLHSLLETQHVARMPDIEVLYLLDNRRRPVGAKRNALLSIARGEYVTFIDDDDEVASEYVAKIYRAIVATRKTDAPADVVCFRQRAVLQPHGVVHECSYSLAHYRDRKPEQRRILAAAYDPATGDPIQNTLLWTGPPAHTMAWRRALVADIQFPERTFGEDVAWVDAACERAVTEVQIDATLYVYQFNEDKSATRG